MQEYFADILRRYGYANDNIADVSAAYYISLWKIVHGRELTARRIAGVRRQMRGFMAQEARLVRLPDAQKQEICETFALHTALALQGYEQLVRSGDAATLANFRRQARTAGARHRWNDRQRRGVRVGEMIRGAGAASAPTMVAPERTKRS